MQIKIEALQKTFGAHFSLSVPSLSVSSGTALGLVGNNGAGKTTLLRLLLDLLDADAGVVRFDDAPVAGSDAWKLRTGAFLDESFLLDFLTPDEFFVFTGVTYGMARDEIASALRPYEPFLARGVLDDPHRTIRDLSTGNRKKVGIVAALFSAPDLLVLDEPFTNLDPGAQIWLLEQLLHIHRTCGATLVVSSHDLGHVVRVCSRIVALEHGRVAMDAGTSEDTLAELRSFFASRAGTRRAEAP